MATTATKSYDPVKALEGMFNGSVTRIAYVLKDPTNYGPNTKTVLAECAKRFQDALDDCEIQLLDAKWFLEHQLAQNKARREEKEREKEDNTAAAKRKTEELQEAENAGKRAKTEQEAVEKAEPPSESKTNVEVTQQPAEEPATTKQPEPASEPDKPTKEEPKNSETETERATEKDKEQEKAKSVAEKTTTEPEKPAEPPVESKAAVDDFAKPTPQATPIATNDDFNFESMFGDPSVDGNDDMNLDLGLGDAFANDPDLSMQDTSLSSLLPNLDTGGELKNTSQAIGDSLPAFSNDFDLPDLGGPNAFDDFLNDENLEAGEFDGNVDLTDEAFNNMSFDDMFDGGV